MIDMVEPVEAVIISGPRKGQIVRLSEEMLDQVSDEDLKQLSEALGELLAAVERYQSEVRTTTELFRAKAEQA